MKKLIVILLALFVVLSVVACSSPSDSNGTEQTKKTDNQQTGGSISDTSNLSSETDEQEPEQSTSLNTMNVNPNDTNHMDVKVEQIEARLKKFLEDEKITGVFHVVFEHEEKEIVIQVFVDEGSDFEKTIARYEQDFQTNAALSEEDQKQWDSWVESYRNFAAEITAQIHNNTVAQFGGVNNRILLQIRNGEIEANLLVNND